MCKLETNFISYIFALNSLIVGPTGEEFLTLIFKIAEKIVLSKTNLLLIRNLGTTSKISDDCTTVTF